MDEQHPGDGAAWLRLCSAWDASASHWSSGLLTPFPRCGRCRGCCAACPAREGRLRQDVLTPVIDAGPQQFGGEHPRLLLAGNAGHADIPLDAAGSGLMAVLLCMLGQTVGFPVPEGGAGRLTQALADRSPRWAARSGLRHPGRPRAGREGTRRRRPHGRGGVCAPGTRSSPT